MNSINTKVTHISLNSGLGTNPSKNSTLSKKTPISKRILMRQSISSAFVPKNKEEQIRKNLLDELDDLTSSYIKRFKEKIPIKSDAEIAALIPKDIDEFKSKVNLVILKADEQLKSYTQKLENMKQRNLELRTNIEKINQQKERMKAELKESEYSIEKLNRKYQIFSELQPYYKELVLEFDVDKMNIGKNNNANSNRDKILDNADTSKDNNMNTNSSNIASNTITSNNKEVNINNNINSTLNPPNKTMRNTLSNDIRNRKKYIKENELEIEQKEKEIRKFYEDKHDWELEQRKKTEEISNKLKKIEEANRNLGEDFNQKLSKLHEEIERNHNLKQKNIDLHNALISFHNLLFPALNLERNVVKNPGKHNPIYNQKDNLSNNIKESDNTTINNDELVEQSINYKNGTKGKSLNLILTDYTPSTYSTDEIKKYIDLMLKNSNQDTAGLLLRETVAYANMMLRTSVPGFENKNYDPYFTVIEIEKLIKKVKGEKEQLNSIIVHQREENEQLLQEVNLLKDEIKKMNIYYDALTNQMSDVFHKDIKEQNKNNLKKENDNIIINENVNKKNQDLMTRAKSANKPKLTLGLINNPNNNLITEDNIIQQAKDKKTRKETAAFFSQFLNEKKIYRPKTQRKEKIIDQDIIGNAQDIVKQANRVFFYQNNMNVLNTNEKNRGGGVYDRAHWRIKCILNRLNRIEHNSNNFEELEKEVEKKMKKNIEKIVEEIKNETKVS